MESNYASRHLLGSDPDYQELNRLQMMLCYAYNPQLAIRDPERMDIEPLMIPSLIHDLKRAMGQLMDEGNFREFRAAWSRSKF